MYVTCLDISRKYLIYKLFLPRDRERRVSTSSHHLATANLSIQSPERSSADAPLPTDRQHDRAAAALAVPVHLVQARGLAAPAAGVV